MWDGIAALQWIQDNIQNFGGDKDRVTIFGQSAGNVRLFVISRLILYKISVSKINFKKFKS